MRFLYHPYVKQVGAAALLLAWLLVFGIKGLHTHRHASDDVANVHSTSENVFGVSEKDHHHCSICEYQLLGDTVVSLANIIEPPILLAVVFVSLQENDLSRRDTHSISGRGPPTLS